MLTFTLLLIGQICSGGSCNSGFGFGGLFAPRVSAYHLNPPYGVYNYVPTPAVTYAPRAVTYVQPNPPAVVATVAPRYTRHDSDGNPWIHTDPKYLEAWVAGRNAAMASTRAKVVHQTRATATCTCNGEECVCSTPGECGRPNCKSVAFSPPPPPSR